MLLTEVKATEIKSNKKQQKSRKTILFGKLWMVHFNGLTS